jgi:hypothetical protein
MRPPRGSAASACAARRMQRHTPGLAQRLDQYLEK